MKIPEGDIPYRCDRVDRNAGVPGHAVFLPGCGNEKAGLLRLSR
jgi:hypothetical protein